MIESIYPEKNVMEVLIRTQIFKRKKKNFKIEEKIERGGKVKRKRKFLKCPSNHGN